MTPVQKDEGMVRQKAMLQAHAERAARARDEGRKVVYTFVPGNLVELLLSFDVEPVYPEITALQSGMRRASDRYIREAERAGHAEDVCSYVKCDVGMALAGDVGPGKTVPAPDLLLLSGTGCATFYKWFESLAGIWRAPVALLQVPYQADGAVTDEMRRYVVAQIRDDVIPALERLTGRRFDIDRLREHLRLSARAEDAYSAVVESARRRPSPIDAYFGMVFYVGPIFTALRGTLEAVEYYERLRAEVETRARAGLGPVTPDGPMGEQRFRLVVEGPPCWTAFRDLWKLFSDAGAVVVASTYSKVGGLYDTGFRHDPDRPLESLADYCLGCYTNLSLPQRLALVERYVRDYEADGFVVHSVKSCKAFGVGQPLLLREVERRAGVPGCFLESDLVDSRYFSHANVRNRLESFLQAIDMRRKA
ncbi:MAG: benzoyl-CoA reductase subunit B [Myxococcota bacterium]